MAKYYHAHKVDPDKCRGHMTCLRQCSSQAIRVRAGKATIMEELCIDCGKCLSVCPSGAVVLISDPIAKLPKFKHKVVVPSPALYSQFDPSIHPYIIHLALKQLGFDDVVDGNISALALGNAMLEYIKGYKGRLPLISSYCPSIVRLIQVKYPDLVELIVPMDVPREMTAREIRRHLPSKLGIKPEELGIYYLANCPAKIVSIRQPAEKAKSWFDDVISIKDTYPILLPHVVNVKEEFDPSMVPEDFSFSSGWSSTGSIIQSIKAENWLAVSGIDHVMQILDDIENSRLRNVVFVEALAHMFGCLGGPLNVENPYVAQSNSNKQRHKYESHPKREHEDIQRKLREGYYSLEHAILPRPTEYFDTDLETSIKRMKEQERVYQKLRQIDCGCCGSPTCKVFAEDFVRGQVKLTDCIFLSQSQRTDGE
ncbi:MAG: 4Fe-4S binding protein [candidate division Zixibacteria bacterium]|nr:4Fe-4S binding protein [candidate division Zixibacteria bacterium]